MQRKHRLYPPIEIPERPTWEHIERLALHYPQAHLAVTLVQRGDMTREEALFRLVFVFASEFQRLFEAEVDRLMTEPMSPTAFSP